MKFKTRLALVLVAAILASAALLSRTAKVAGAGPGPDPSFLDDFESGVGNWFSFQLGTISVELSGYSTNSNCTASGVPYSWCTGPGAGTGGYAEGIQSSNRPGTDTPSDS